MTSHPRGQLGDARGRKIENGPIDLKIATDIKFNTRNPKIIILNVKNQPFPLGEGQKCSGTKKFKGCPFKLKIDMSIRKDMRNSNIVASKFHNQGSSIISI